MKKTAIWALLCVLLLTGCGQAPGEGAESAEPPKAAESVPAEEPELTPVPGGQETANQAYGQILDSFGGLLPHDPGYPGYPEEFGEAYYEDGYLVICLTENTREMREKYRALVDTPEILQFREVAYSYNDLYALQMAIKPTEDMELTSWGVDVMENRVEIGIPDLSREEETLALILEGLPTEVKERFSEYPIAFREEGPVFTA